MAALILQAEQVIIIVTLSAFKLAGLLLAGKNRSAKGKFSVIMEKCIDSAQIGVFALLTFASKYDPSLIENMITPTKIAAHKGYSSRAPENAMPAFALAVDCDQADYIELDIRETKDGVPIVIHDANLQTAAGQNISVYDISFSELQQIHTPYGFQESDFPGVTIPSLEQVLEAYAGKKDFIIEIKASPLAPELPGEYTNRLRAVFNMSFFQPENAVS